MKINEIAERYGEDIQLAEDDALERVMIFRKGEEVHHPNGDFTVDAEFVQDLVSSYEKVTSSGFRVPVLVEHQADGRIYGEVVRLYEGPEGVFVDLELAAGIREEWDAGLRRNVSPSVWKERAHPHTGEVLKNVLREVSMVSVPHLKNLTPPPLHYALHESGFIESGQPTEAKEAHMADENASVEETELMEDEDLELGDALKALMERMDAMEQKMAEYMEGDPEEMEEGEESDDMSEGAVHKLMERVASLEHDKAALEVRSELGVEGEDLKEMTELKLSSPRAYNLAAKRMKSERAREVGFAGFATGSRVTMDQALQECAEKGIPKGRKTIDYLDSNYPHLLHN